MTICNNKIFNFILTILGKTSVAIGPFIVYKSEASETICRSRHLRVHARQWTEVTLTSIILILLFDGLNIGSLISSVFIYYIWWGIETLVRSLVSMISSVDAGDVAFETEAEYAEEAENLVAKVFGWVKYLND